jgi:hypothetical protein
MGGTERRNVLICPATAASDDALRNPMIGNCCCPCTVIGQTTEPASDALMKSPCAPTPSTSNDSNLAELGAAGRAVMLRLFGGKAMSALGQKQTSADQRLPVRSLRYSALFKRIRTA